MRKSMLGRKMRALAGVLVASAVMVAGFSGGPASAAEAPLATAPEIGVQFFADDPNNPSQCRGSTGQQWAATPGWTAPILIDSDQRYAGCQLAFGIYDGDGGLAGLSLTTTWQPSHGGNGATQCGNPGTHQVPVNQFRVFGPLLGADTDQREGWCNLTFTVSGRSDVAVDVQWYPEFGNNGQCQGYVPQGQYRTAYPGAPLTIGVDTDSRNGGCWFALRLRQA